MYRSGKRIQNPSLLVPQAHDGLQGATLLADTSMQYTNHTGSVGDHAQMSSLTTNIQSYIIGS